MIFKICGAILITSACTLTGFCLKNRYLIYLNHLENFNLCLDILYNEISLSLKNMHDAFETICNHANGCNFNLFKKISTVSEMSDGNAISDIWLNCIEEDTSFKNIYDKEDVREFKEFGRSLGSPNIEINENNIKNLKNRINKKINIIKPKAEKMSVFGKLGFYFGIVIVIILI